jgi:hypothetical protein
MIRFLRAWWLDRRCRYCQRRFDLATELGDYDAAREWQTRLEKLGKWDRC